MEESAFQIKDSLPPPNKTWITSAFKACWYIPYLWTSAVINWRWGNFPLSLKTTILFSNKWKEDSKIHGITKEKSSSQKQKLE